MIVAVGNCRERMELAGLDVRHGFELISAVHPAAVINPQAVVGENVIVNTSAAVDHACHIETGVHIGPRACLGGGVHVGKASWIGIGATIKDHVRIGNNVLVEAESVVVKDLPDNVVAYRIPARIQRKR